MRWGLNIFCGLRILGRVWEVEGKYLGLSIGKYVWDKFVFIVS